MKFFALISLLVLLSSAAAQELSCNYVNGTINNVPSYFCYLTANNPNGLEDITSVAGDHLPGFTDADVVGVFSWFGVTTNLPPVICNQFTNLVFLDATSFQINTVSENALNGCANLEFLRFFNNQLMTLPENIFSNNQRLEYIDFDRNHLATLPENVFANLANLEWIELQNNPFQELPGGLFRGLTRLDTLYLQNASITAINPAWFEDLANLEILTFYRNEITEITEDAFAAIPCLRVLEISRNPIGQNIHIDAFRSLTGLELLYIANNNLGVFNPQLFAPLTNLVMLYAYSNNFGEIPAGAFDVLPNLWLLDIASNGLNESTIPGNAFDVLPELVVLFLDDNTIRDLNPAWFTNLPFLEDLFLDFNQIEELPAGIFTPFNALWEVTLWGNELKTINRNAFGNLDGFVLIDLDENVINAVDERFFEDTPSLQIIFFFANLCSSVQIINFGVNRPANVERFRRCIDNFAFIVDIETDGAEEYQFHPGRLPGIQLRVQTTGEINIALTSYDFPWQPMLEVIIGTANNTRSVIRRNQEEDVVTVPTPGIIRNGQLNGFRISWSNFVVLAFREGEEWPFMGFTMTDLFPVNFYGLRAPLNPATWSVQPIGGI